MSIFPLFVFFFNINGPGPLHGPKKKPTRVLCYPRVVLTVLYILGFWPQSSYISKRKPYPPLLLQRETQSEREREEERPSFGDGFFQGKSTIHLSDQLKYLLLVSNFSVYIMFAFWFMGKSKKRNWEPLHLICNFYHFLRNMRED
jgi:hypothetical protein